MNTQSILNRAIRIAAHPATVFVFALMAAFVVAWSWPKATDDRGRFFTYYLAGGSCDLRARYRGFQRLPGLIGPRYYRVQATFQPRRGPSPEFTFNVNYVGPGTNLFESQYPDGTLQSKGLWHVDYRTPPSPPDLLPDNIYEGEFYRPDGSLGSSVRLGNGYSTLWYPDGTKLREVEIRNSQPVCTRIWGPTGELELQQNSGGKGYNVLEDTLVQFDSSGSKKSEGKIVGHGLKTGPWTHYRPDGTIEKIEHYGTRGELLRTEEFPHERKAKESAAPVGAAAVPNTIK